MELDDLDQDLRDIRINLDLHFKYLTCTCPEEIQDLLYFPLRDLRLLKTFKEFKLALDLALKYFRFYLDSLLGGDLRLDMDLPQENLNFIWISS